jgi:hypothetical protein
MKYFFRRKWEQIKRVIDFLPIIWEGYDFDYIYLVNLFKHQLKRQADYLESDRAMTITAKDKAKRIRTAIKLLNKVYDGDYEEEYIDKIEKLYGKTHFKFIPSDYITEDGTNTYELKSWNENAVDEKHQEEIDALSREMMLLSRDKQEKAHKILWKFIEHNIRHWWD